MKTNRRSFLRESIVAGASIPFLPAFLHSSNEPLVFSNAKFRFYPYTLDLKHTFTLAMSSRTTTPVMMVEFEQDGIVGFGEASMPPYLGETQETAKVFLSQVDFSRYGTPLTFEEILKSVDAIAPGNNAAKAAVDIALHDWVGKKFGFAWHQVWGLDPKQTPVTTFTIGIDTPDVVRQKVKEADEYKVLKVKLGRENDKEMITTIREVTDKPLRVDVNQGWKDKAEALKMIEWLATKGVELVEQPMQKENLADMAWLNERSPLPIVGDESVTRLADLRNAYGVFSGINVKLMKTTGMHEAYKLITAAKALGMKVMLGCMTETSCAISAAAQMSPLVDWADLDGAVLIKNDLFQGASIVDGRVTLTEKPGIGATKRL